MYKLQRPTRRSVLQAEGPRHERAPAFLLPRPDRNLWEKAKLQGTPCRARRQARYLLFGIASSYVSLDRARILADPHLRP
jgi:hypothetical protein